MKKKMSIVIVILLTIPIIISNSKHDINFKEKKISTIIKQNQLSEQAKIDIFDKSIQTTKNNYQNNFIKNLKKSINELNDKDTKTQRLLLKLKIKITINKDAKEFNHKIDNLVKESQNNNDKSKEFNHLLESLVKHQNKDDQADFVLAQIIVNEYKRQHNLKTSTVIKTLNNKPIKLAYLTFDDGPSNKSIEIINKLKSNKIEGTFFLIGNQINKNKPIMNTLIKSNNTLGLHGYSHDYKKTNDYSIMSQELITTQSLLHNLNYDTKLFRCPYGTFTIKNKDMPKYINKYSVLDWNIDSLDWKHKRNYRKVNHILNRQFDSLKDQDLIILFHEYESTIDNLDIIIKRLKKDNYYFVKMNPEYFYSSYFNH